MKRVRVIRHVSEESLGSLAPALRAGGLELDVVDSFSPGWPAFERAGLDAAELAGLVLMGGTMNANQTREYPFLATELEWLRQAVAAGMPTLGICLGAQLLARALGARVAPNEVKEIGWHSIDLLPAARDDRLLGHGHASEIVFQWHSDTFELPVGAVQLARSAACQQQAFRYGQSAWGLQFHPEMTAEMVVDWLAEPGMCAEVSAVGYVDTGAIRGRAPTALAAMAPFTEQIFGQFAHLCCQWAGAA